jgi:RNA polymerase sigma-70 factor (ECF subfamily)
MRHHPAPTQAGQLSLQVIRQPLRRLGAVGTPQPRDRFHIWFDAAWGDSDSASYDAGVQPPDEEVVARAQTGDPDAFAELVRRFEPRIRAVLWRLLEDERDLEEATQDTFVQAWRNLDRYRAEARPFTWFYRIAVNEALMRRRRRRPATVELDEADSAEPGAAVPELADAAELGRFLAARIRALPPDDRAALVLRDLEGLSNAEVAEVLGLSVVAAKSRIHRARMRIRAELERWRANG